MLYRELLVRLIMVLLVLVAGELLVSAIERAHAATVGYRIEVRVCDDRFCAQIRTAESLWAGQYACAKRAGTIQGLAVDFLNDQRFEGARPSLKVGAECVPVVSDKQGA
jgi:hypothetical protein